MKYEIRNINEINEVADDKSIMRNKLDNNNAKYKQQQKYREKC